MHESNSLSMPQMSDRQLCLSYLMHFKPVFNYISNIMRNMYRLIQIEFITDFTNVQHVIITQI
jgi:hypothetical protein